MARHQGIPQQPLRRAADRRHHSHQDASTSIRRQLRYGQLLRPASAWRGRMVANGTTGVWGGLFSTFDCTVKGIRKKEDPYNAIS